MLLCVFIVGNPDNGSDGGAPYSSKPEYCYLCWYIWDDYMFYFRQTLLVCSPDALDHS